MHDCSHCNQQPIDYVVTALPRAHGTQRFYENHTQILPHVHVLDAVDGMNHTAVIEELLDSQLRFHSLSKGSRRWGKLATWLTKYRALMRQVERRTAFQVTFEEDVALTPAFCEFVQRACALHARGARREPRAGGSSLPRHGAISLVQMSTYAEVLLTPLGGAISLTQQMREHGILRNDDQQLLDPKVMGRDRHDTVRYRGKDLLSPPYVLARKTNVGDIFGSPSMSWAEMALLRLLTEPSARARPAFGNPPGVDVCSNKLHPNPGADKCENQCAMTKRAAPARKASIRELLRRFARVREAPS